MAEKRVESIDNGIGKQVVPFMFSKANCNALGKAGILERQCMWKVTTQKADNRIHTDAAWVRLAETGSNIPYPWNLKHIPSIVRASGEDGT